MSDDCQHIHPRMQHYLAIDGVDRLHQCWNKIWVPTPSTKEAFIALTDCLAAPDSGKPRGLVLTGISDTGKTRTMRQFLEAHPASMQHDSEYAEHPVVYVLAPDKPSRNALYKAILKALGHPISYHAREDDLRALTVDMLQKCRVRTVMIDEFHDISHDQVNNLVLDFLRAVKGLMNATGRPFVVGGVPAVFVILKRDPESSSRLSSVVTLKELSPKKFTDTVLGFERLIPLRRPSNLIEDEEALFHLYELSGGYIGRLSNILYDAAQKAITEGSERITLPLLMKMPDRTMASAVANLADRAGRQR